MNNKEKLVAFDIWCPKCKYKNKREEEEPCDECLAYPVNENSTKPVMWEGNK